MTDHNSSPKQSSSFALILVGGGVLFLIPAFLMINLLYAVLGPAPVTIETFSSDSPISQTFFSHLSLGSQDGSTEAIVYDRVASLLGGALGVRPGDASVSAMVWESLCAIIYVCCSLWRIWMMIFIAIVGHRFLVNGYHRRFALLGDTGRDPFFSGVKIDGNVVSRHGEVNLLIPGLATLPRCSASELRRSPLLSVLSSAGVVNETIRELGRVILHAKDVPCFLPPPTEMSLPDRNLNEDASSLNSITIAQLGVVLKLRRLYQKGNKASSSPNQQPKIESDTSLSLPRYIKLFEQAVNSSLSTYWKGVFAKIGEKELAVTVLASSAGQAFSAIFEGGRWHRSSYSLGTSSRSVLHSIPSFSEEFDSTSRDMIRRALLFAEREGAAGVIALPETMTPETLVLRHVAELLIVPPPDLTGRSEEARAFLSMRES